MKVKKLTKKVIFSFAGIFLVVLLCLASFAAANYLTPAETLASLTTRTQDDIRNERITTGNSYCTIASRAGVLNEYHDEILLMREDTINKMVEDKTLTRVEADALISALKDTPDFCDGYGNQGYCYNYYGGGDSSSTNQYGRHHNQTNNYRSSADYSRGRGCCSGRGRAYN